MVTLNPTWTASDITTSADQTGGVFAADIDGDGDMDIVSANTGDDTIAWYENDGAENPTWTAADIATSADGAIRVYAADIDGDGDMDIISGSALDDKIAWYANDGAVDPSFSTTVTVRSCAISQVSLDTPDKFTTSPGRGNPS